MCSQAVESLFRGPSQLGLTQCFLSLPLETFIYLSGPGEDSCQRVAEGSCGLKLPVQYLHSQCICLHVPGPEGGVGGRYASGSGAAAATADEANTAS